MTGAPFHVGDTAEPLEFALSSYNRRTRRSTPTNLTGASLEVHCKLPNGEVLDVEGEATDEVGGLGKHEWEPDELLLSGKWAYEVEVTYSNGRIQTFGPDYFMVAPQIA
jgi:hypothetical protein